jgi:predicted  nucleic acid-binding Zn-ribbon protein
MALEEVTEENLQLNEQLTIVQRESHDLNKEMEEVEHECEELEIEIARNNKLQSAKREEATEWKKKHTDLQNELATAKLALQEKHIELENLQTKLVSSPERHTQNVKDLQSALKKVRKDGNQLEEEWQRIKTISVHISQAIKDVPIVTRQLRQLVDNCNRISHIRDDITKTKSEKETLCQLTSEVNEKIQSLEASHNRSEEKLQHMRKQYKLKMDAAQEALESAKLRLLQVDQEQSEGMARVEAGEAELKALEKQFDQERCRTDQEIEEMMQIYSAMEHKVLNEHISFMDALQIA